MSDLGTLLLDAAFLALFGFIGLAFLVAGFAWFRLLSYRISPPYLELRLVHITVRRVHFSEIVGADLRGERGNWWLPSLWFAVSGLWQPWKAGGFLSTERWANTFGGPFVLVRRRRGRSIALTPADPDHFIDELAAAVRIWHPA